jgi:hypothetical protein
MAYLLNIGPYAFFVPKYAITIIGTFELFMFRAVVIQKLKVSTHSFLYLAAWIYVAVVAGNSIWFIRLSDPMLFGYSPPHHSQGNPRLGLFIL